MCDLSKRNRFPLRRKGNVGESYGAGYSAKAAIRKLKGRAGAPIRPNSNPIFQISPTGDQFDGDLWMKHTPGAEV